MSNFFKAIWGGVKKVVGVVDHVVDTYVQPYSGLLNIIPGPAGTVLSMVVHVEEMTADLLGGNGAQKKAAVKAFVKLKYPKADDGKIDRAVDHFVAGFNELKDIPAE